MKLKIIKTKKDYQAYLNWLDELFDKKVAPGSALGEQLQVALSALLNKKKPLNLELAKIFHRELGIPAEVLLS